MTQPAKMLSAAELRRVVSHVTQKSKNERGRVMVLLSFKAGLRAGEIAGLDWTMLLRPGGGIGQHIAVSGMIAKNGRPRRVPFNPELRRCVISLHREAGWPAQGAVIRSQRGGNMTPKGVVNWFGRLYAELGLAGCSSHSGRRTFITQSARLLSKVGGSLKDVQELAGHSSLATTERYIEGDRDVQRRLLRML